MTDLVYIMVVEGLDKQGPLDTPALKRAAVRAVNKTADRARTAADRGIRKQVALSASYLSPSQKRLYVSKRATQADIEGRILARSRPTSLARFTKDPLRTPEQNRRRKDRGVRLTVKPGVSRYLRRSFLIPLRAGSTELGNVGLAVRSESAPPGAYKPKKLGKNLWLLYGPSVSQVLYSDRNKGGVADDIAPETADFLEREFLRLYDAEID